METEGEKTDVIATMSTVWDRTAEFLSDNLTALTPIVLFGIFAPLTIYGNLMPLMGTSGQIGDWALGVILVILTLVTIWAGIAITALAFDPGAGRGAAVGTATRRLLPVLGVGLITTLVALIVAMLFAVPIGIALGLNNLDFAALAGDKALSPDAARNVGQFFVVFSVTCGTFLLWMYSRFVVFVTPIMVMERRGLGTYGRSFVLTRSIAWKVVGVVLLYGVVTLVSSLATKTVLGSIFALLLGGEGTVTLASVLTQIVAAGISTVFSVMAVAFIAKLYLATRDARESIVEA